MRLRTSRRVSMQPPQWTTRAGFACADPSGRSKVLPDANAKLSFLPESLSVSVLEIPEGLEAGGELVEIALLPREEYREGREAEGSSGRGGGEDFLYLREGLRVGDNECAWAARRRF